jgi:NCS2 family nucleobase:cation symporter-2
MPASKRPPNLIYAVDEHPPVATLLLLGLQHLFILAGMSLLFPALLARAAGVGAEEARNFVIACMLASGAGTLLQAWRRTGSGFLCPEACGPAYLPAAMLAAKSGGLALVAGMTLLVGLVEVAFARLLPKLRVLFPPEVTGTVAAMVGISLMPVAAPALQGIGPSTPEASRAELLVGLLTLGTLVGVTVWSRGALRLYSMLLAIAVGYIAAIALGILGRDELELIKAAPAFALPRPPLGHWAFDAAMLFPFLVAVLSSSLKAMGDITTCQKINDLEWRRVDMSSATRGVGADGWASVLGGLLGGLGQSSYSSNIGLSVATGATSRVIGFAIGGFMIALAFMPRAAALFAVVPQPVLGALLVFAAAFMFIAGMQIVMSRMLDARKTFVVAMPLLFGLSVEFSPELYAGVPAVLSPLFDSALALATSLALALNLIMRIGIAKRALLEVGPEQPAGKSIFDFLERQGEAWGARREVIERAIAANLELAETARRGPLLDQGRFTLAATFNELNLTTELTYTGAPVALNTRLPTEEELLSDEQAFDRLATYLAARRACQIGLEHAAGITTIRARFAH